VEYGFALGMWLNLRLGQATRGKWKIPNGKVENGLFSCSKL
jgi:hypothetical protein